MTVLGIDVSSEAVDLVLLDADSNRATTLHIALGNGKKHPLLTRTRRVMERFPGPGWLEDAGVYLVAIEDPMSRFPHTAKALGLVTGAVLALIPRRYTVVSMQPNEWKRLTVGQPGASKERIAEWARSELNHDEEVWPQDGYDAYCIARAVRRHEDGE